MMSILKRIAVLVAVAVVASCGGGGSDSGSSPFNGGTGTGSGGGTTIAAADLIVTLSKPSIANTGSDVVTITTTAIDSARNVVAGAPVEVTADSDAVVVRGSPITGSNGQSTATVSIGANRSNRLINVTVTSGSVSKTAIVQVVGAKVTGTVVPGVVNSGAAGKVEFRLLDQAGNGMADEEITVVATGLTPATIVGRTGASGNFDFNFTAPAASGAYPVTATAGGATTEPAPVVQVLGATAVPPVTATITSASVSANPSVVGVNSTSSTANRSEIRALFLGANNLPIRNVRVRFDLEGDANSIGGTFTSGASTLYSDANGVVTTAYVAGTRSSPTNGVTVRACYGNTDADPGLLTCTKSTRVTLTVSSEPLGVSIGTNELIIVNELTYVKKFIVFVADAAGNALADVNIAVSVDLLNFRKGEYVVGAKWTKVERAICLNEDGNRNGVLEIGEDLDLDARLEPGKSDVTVSLLQTKTRGDGTAELQIQYAKSFGSWVDAKITVSASGVAGTEGRASWLLAPVPVDAASLGNLEVAPAYRLSPYGILAGCSVSG